MSEVIHLADESRFVINLDGAQAVLAYELYDDSCNLIPISIKICSLSENLAALRQGNE